MHTYFNSDTKKDWKIPCTKSNRALAQECLESEGVRKHIMLRLGILLRQELKMMCSPTFPISLPEFILMAVFKCRVISSCPSVVQLNV